jgi:FKBP-type peptidyl-prolyl cis-trans isomerase FklB
VLTSGSGRSVPPDGTVTVRFRGTLIDGTEFAQADRAELRVAAMMPGGRAAATRMRAGDHWQVAIPPELAFGPAGNPPLVGPNEVLLFDVEVLDVRSSS